MKEKTTTIAASNEEMLQESTVEVPVKQIPVLTIENYLESKAQGRITLKQEFAYGKPSVTIIQRRYDSLTGEPVDHVLPNVTPQNIQSVIDGNEEVRKNGRKNAEGTTLEQGTNELESSIQSQEQSIEQMKRNVKQQQHLVEQRNEAFDKINRELSVVLADVQAEYSLAEKEAERRFEEMSRNLAQTLTKQK